MLDSEEQKSFSHRIGEMESRKLKVQQSRKKSVWSGLALFGMVGWSVVVPTIAGTALGVWLDRHYRQPSISWTLTFLVAGLIFGCFMAWRWIEREHKDMHEQNQQHKHE